MAWQPNIPLATDRLSVSQADLQGNFQAIDAWSLVNHNSIGAAAATLGMHKWVTFTPQAAPIAPLDAATHVNLWNPTGVNQGAELRLRFGASGLEFPMTGNNASKDSGYTYYPSGFTLKWQRLTQPVGLHTFDFNTFGPAWTNMYSVWFQARNANNNLDTNRAYIVTNMSVGGSPSSVEFRVVLRDSSLADPGIDSFLIIGIGS